MEQIPPLPSNTTDRVARFAFRLPRRLRVHALRIIANKLAADFAMGFLLLLDESLNDQKQRPAQEQLLDIQDAEDAQTIGRLLELWADIPGRLNLPDTAHFERFARVTAGLHMMIDAAPAEARDSWVFDSGSQYRSMLLQIGVLPSFAISAHGVSDGKGEPSGAEVKLIRFDGREPGTYTSRVGWTAPGSRDDNSGPIEARLISAPTIEQGPALASAS